VSILAEKFLSEGTAIIDVRLGYHGQVFNSETRVLAPFWRVLTESGEQYYVHAITGAVE
jgi:regulatory protein YycI of two-component signal transduction system YycFG